MHRSAFHQIILPALLSLLLLPVIARHVQRHRGDSGTRTTAASVMPQLAKQEAVSAETPSTAEAAPESAAQPAAPVETAPAATDETTAEPKATEVPAPENPSAPSDPNFSYLGGGPECVQLTKEEQRFVTLINEERRKQKAQDVVVVPLLVGTARAKSQEMHDLNYWGHQSPDPERRTAMPRVLKALAKTPRSMLVGENLYYCSTVLVEEGHKALMNSPTHRKNILNPEYRYVGVGAFQAKDGRFWVTEHFLNITF